MSITIDQEKLTKIEKQVERWDIMAKTAPIVFLAISFVFLALDLSYFDILFFMGSIFFATTAAIWWFWIISTIRFLARIYKKTTENLIEVADDLKQIREEYKELRDEKINNK